MSAFSAWLNLSSGPAADSIGLILVVKWTAVLAMSWLAHGILSGRIPRWRVVKGRRHTRGR
jgi:hypothetical protein